MTDTTVAGIAAQVSQVDEAVMKYLPYVSGLIGFIPGAAVAVPFMPLVGELLQAVDTAAKQVQAGNAQAAIGGVLQEIIDHLTAGKPNSPALT